MSALSALGVAPEKPSFPAVVVCPLCQKNALHLFDDISTDGIWLHCNSCLAHGDIITFGAQIWNISLPAALTKLSDAGVVSKAEVDRAAGAYTRAIARQQVAETFWAETSQQVWNHGDDALACKLREWGVREEIEATAGFIGIAHPDQVAAFCRAIGRAKPHMVRKYGPSVVFPYYDLPGRITGFLLLRENAEKGKRLFFGLAGYDRRKPDAGYFLLDSLLKPTIPALQSKQFIVDDPLWALREQCRQLRHGQRLLPIAASYAGPDAVSYGTNWVALGPATRVFQSHVATPELLSQAITAKGYVAINALDTKDSKTGSYTLHRLGGIYHCAVPWHQGLHAALSSASEITAAAFAMNLVAPHEKLQAFFQKYSQHYSEDFKNRVLQAVRVAPAQPSRVYKKWAVVEQGTSWFTHNGLPVCNARIVIEKIIQTDAGEKYYTGKIYQNDWELEFSDTARRIESVGLLAYAAALAAPYGKLITHDRQWNKRSHNIAIQMRPPELVVVSTHLGWDEKARVFRFGNYALNNSGEIDTTIPPTCRKNHKPFPEPAAIGPLPVRQFLTPGPQSAFVWNVFSVIAANLLAPVVNKDCTATAVQADAFDVAVKIGAELNCTFSQTTNLQRGSAAIFVRKHASESDWPVFVSSVFDETLLMLAVPKTHNNPVLAKIATTGATVALSYGWQKLCAGVALDITTDFSALRHVLPAYIQHALKHRLSLTTKNKNLATAVLHDVHAWLDTTYGATFHLPQALQQFTAPDKAHEALLREIHTAIKAGKIDLIPRPRRKDQPKNYILRRKENWWVNRRAVDNYTHEGKNIHPNWLTIIDLLSGAGVFNGEETVHGMPGILVRADWCESFEEESGSVVREIG